MRPPLYLATLAALALAAFLTYAEDAAPPATDSVVVDAPTKAGAPPALCVQLPGGARMEPSGAR